MLEGSFFLIEFAHAIKNLCKFALVKNMFAMKRTVSLTITLLGILIIFSSCATPCGC